jgi:hypothetical protein
MTVGHVVDYLQYMEVQYHAAGKVASFSHLLT